MEFARIKDFLKFSPEDAAAFEVRFDASEQAFPDTVPECLTEPYVREYFGKLEYREDLSDELVSTLEKIIALPELYHFVWHVIHRTFFDPKGGQWMGYYTIPDDILGERAKGLVNLIIALASMKPFENTFRRMGIPLEYALKQHRWIAGTIDIYRHAHHGLPGHTLQQTAWLRFNIDGRLFRVGRFEYLLENTYPARLPIIYKNRSDGRLVYFARNGWTVDKDGFLSRAETSERTLTFTDADGKISGTCVRFDGRFDQAETVLDASDYEPLAAPWSLTVSFHIPGGERLMPEAAGESLKEAHEFFKKYLKRDIPVFVCHSWIFNPEWRKRLPESNLAKLQKSLFLIPSAAEKGDDGLFFIFGTSEVPLDAVPENTMQKTMLDVMKDGISLRSGVAVVPTCRLDKFGCPEEF